MTDPVQPKDESSMPVTFRLNRGNPYHQEIYKRISNTPDNNRAEYVRKQLEVGGLLERAGVLDLLQAAGRMKGVPPLDALEMALNMAKGAGAVAPAPESPDATPAVQELPEAEAPAPAKEPKSDFIQLGTLA